jgi:WD40 repeat protein
MMLKHLIIIIIILLAQNQLFSQTKIFEQSLPGGVLKKVKLSLDGQTLTALGDTILYRYDVNQGNLIDSIDLRKFYKNQRVQGDITDFISSKNDTLIFRTSKQGQRLMNYAYRYIKGLDSVKTLIYGAAQFYVLELGAAFSEDESKIYMGTLIDVGSSKGVTYYNSKGYYYDLTRDTIFSDGDLVKTVISNESEYLGVAFEMFYNENRSEMLIHKNGKNYQQQPAFHSLTGRVLDFSGYASYCLTPLGIYNFEKYRIEMPLQLPVYDSSLIKYMSFQAQNMAAYIPQTSKFLNPGTIVYLDSGKIFTYRTDLRKKFTFGDTLNSGLYKNIHLRLKPGLLAANTKNTIQVFTISGSPFRASVDFAISRDSTFAGDPIQFRNYVYPSDSVKEYSWDFGDGYTSREISPTHAYNKAGKYTVTLNATLLDGSVISKQEKDKIKIYFTGHPLEWLKAVNTGKMNSIVYSPNGSMIAVGGDKWPVSVVKSDSSPYILEYNNTINYTSYVANLIFSPDSKQLFLQDLNIYKTAAEFTGPYGTNYKSAPIGINTVMGLYECNDFQMLDTMRAIKVKNIKYYHIYRAPWQIKDPIITGYRFFIVYDEIIPSIYSVFYGNSSLLTSIFNDFSTDYCNVGSVYDNSLVRHHYVYYHHGIFTEYNRINNQFYYRLNPELLNGYYIQANSLKDQSFGFPKDTTARAVYGIAAFPEIQSIITSQNQIIDSLKPGFLSMQDFSTKYEFRRYADSAWALRRSPDAVHILTNNGLFDVYQGVYSSLHPYLKNYRTFEYFPDGIHVALFSGGSDSSVRIYNLLKKQIVWGTGKLPSAARCMALSPDGMHLALGLEQNSIIQISLPKLQKMYEIGFGLAKVNLPRDHDTLHFVNSSLPANDSTMSYLWDFGDGSKSTEKSPYHSYALPGTYKVVLQAFKGDSLIGAQVQRFSIGQSVLGIVEAIPAQTIYAAPNPSTAECQIHTSLSEIARVEVYDIQGKAQAIDWYTEGAGIIRLRHSSLSPGHYHVQIYDMQSKVHSIDLFIHH